MPRLALASTSFNPQTLWMGGKLVDPKPKPWSDYCAVGLAEPAGLPSTQSGALQPIDQMLGIFRIPVGNDGPDALGLEVRIDAPDHLAVVPGELELAQLRAAG